MNFPNNSSNIWKGANTCLCSKARATPSSVQGKNIDMHPSMYNSTDCRDILKLVFSSVFVAHSNLSIWLKYLDLVLLSETKNEEDILLLWPLYFKLLPASGIYCYCLHYSQRSGYKTFYQ